MEQENQVQEGQQTQRQQEEVRVDPYEAQAREQGWVPKDDFVGDPEKWRPAKEFVERGELFGKIDSLGKELKETRKTLKMLQEHHSKVKDSEFKRAVAELKEQQKKHLEEGNSDAYLEATELLTDLKAEQKAREVLETQQPQQSNQPDPRFVAWTQENKWYLNNPEMHDFADALGTGYAQRNPNVTPEEVLKYVAAQVKVQFKDKFENPNRNKPSAVEGSGNASPKKSEDFQLTEEERKIMNTFLRQNIMTKEEYLAEVKRSRGV